MVLFKKYWVQQNGKIHVLAKSKLHSIETLVLQALIDMEIIHEDFITILNEKDKYEEMRENKKLEKKMKK